MLVRTPPPHPSPTTLCLSLRHSLSFHLLVTLSTLSLLLDLLVSFSLSCHVSAARDFVVTFSYPADVDVQKLGSSLSVPAVALNLHPAFKMQHNKADLAVQL